MRRASVLAIFLLVSCSGTVASSKDTFSSSSSPLSSSNVSETRKKERLEKEDLRKEEMIRFIGRTQYENERRYMYYTATGFDLLFEGSSVRCGFYAENTENASRQPYFSVMLDDEIAPEGTVFHLTEKNQTVTLAENLTYGIHRIRVLKRSEPYDGITALTFAETDGTFLEKEEDRKMKIQIVGGSGISGHGALGSEGQGRTTANSSSLHAFGYLTARMFDADFQFVSNSGFGLKWGFQPANARQAYDDVGIDGSGRLIGKEWNHDCWIPDLVIVNIGGNDFTAHVNNASDSVEAKKEFKEAVEEFLTHVHTLYPKVKIIWTHTGSQNGTLAEAVISDYLYRKQVKTVVIPKVGSDGDPEGANGHNSVVTHIRTAEILAEEIESFTGDTRVRENIAWPLE